MVSNSSSFARRRISLGSGINPVKLVDTITQMAREESENPRLICQSRVSEAWCQLDRSAEGSERQSSWLLQCGFNVDGTPENVLDALFQGLELEYRVLRYDAGIGVTLLFLGQTSIETIGDAIILVVTVLQHANGDDIELSLEFEGPAQQ
jgi:hypothetical protein